MAVASAVALELVAVAEEAGTFSAAATAVGVLEVRQRNPWCWRHARH